MKEEKEHQKDNGPSDPIGHPLLMAKTRCLYALKQAVSRQIYFNYQLENLREPACGGR